MTRLLLTSDSHLGITKEKSIRKMIRKWRDETFDAIVHLGDYCGTDTAFKPVRHTVRMILEEFPDTHYITTLGNHDLWHKNRRLENWQAQNQAIRDVFKQHEVHFLDDDGPFILGDVVIVGHTGWYTHPKPPTNDEYFLPYSVSHTQLLSEAEKQLQINLDALPDLTGKTLVFASHFPVIKVGDDYKGRFEEFSWSTFIGKMMQETYGCRYFLNGHSHQYHNGPLRYEAGSDYGSPKYLIVDIPPKTKGIVPDEN